MILTKQLDASAMPLGVRICHGPPSAPEEVAIRSPGPTPCLDKCLKSAWALHDQNKHKDRTATTATAKWALAPSSGLLCTNAKVLTRHLRILKTPETKSMDQGKVNGVAEAAEAA